MAARPAIVVACGALSLLGVSIGAARAQGERLATITGHVFAADTNLPVADATVRLTGQGRPRTTPADASGRYEFGDVPPGRYVVSATMSGYAIATHGQSRPTDPPASFALRPAESRSQTDVWLTPLGVVSGQIVDERGAPAAGARVRAVRMTRSAGPIPSALRGRVEAVTDANGDFRLSGLDSGRYHVSATPAPNARTAGAALTTAPTYYPGTEFPDQAQPLHVEAGMQAHVTIALRPSRLARISGRVLDAAGRPAAKQVVLLNGQPPLAPSLPMTAAFQEVDASGRFAFPAVPPGDYRLDVRDTAGFEEIARRGGGPADVVRNGEFASHPLRITGDDVVDLVLRTGSGFTLSGQVVVKGTGAPLRTGVRVSALPADELGALGSLLTGTAHVGEDGSFRIENMAGRKTIRVTGLPAGLTLESVRVRGVDVVDDGIEVTAPVPLEIVLGRPTQIAGRVVDQEGTGVPGTTVVVFSEEPFLRALPHSRYVATTVAGGSGAFTVTGLPPGRYRAVALFAPVEGQAADVESLELLAGFGTAISLDESERVSLTVPIR